MRRTSGPRGGGGGRKARGRGRRSRGAPRRRGGSGGGHRSLGLRGRGGPGRGCHGIRAERLGRKRLQRRPHWQTTSTTADPPVESGFMVKAEGGEFGGPTTSTPPPQPNHPWGLDPFTYKPGGRAPALDDGAHGRVHGGGGTTGEGPRGGGGVALRQAAPLLPVPRAPHPPAGRRHMGGGGRPAAGARGRRGG